jgi:hypothetical protein
MKRRHLPLPLIGGADLDSKAKQRLAPWGRVISQSGVIGSLPMRQPAAESSPSPHTHAKVRSQRALPELNFPIRQVKAEIQLLRLATPRRDVA